MEDSDKIVESKVYLVKNRDHFKTFAFATAGAAISTTIAVTYGLPILAGIAGAYGSAGLMTVLKQVFAKKTKTQILYSEFEEMIYIRDQILEYGTSIRTTEIRRLFNAGIQKPVQDLQSKIDVTGRAILLELRSVKDHADKRDELARRIKGAIKGKTKLEPVQLTEATLAAVVAFVIGDLIFKKLRKVFSSKMQQHLQAVAEKDKLSNKDIAKVFRLATLDLIRGDVKVSEYKQSLDMFKTELSKSL